MERGRERVVICASQLAVLYIGFIDIVRCTQVLSNNDVCCKHNKFDTKFRKKKALIYLNLKDKRGNVNIRTQIKQKLLCVYRVKCNTTIHHAKLILKIHQKVSELFVGVV